MSDQLRVPQPPAGLPLSSPATHVCYRKTVSESYQYLGFLGDLPAKGFPLLDERAQSTDGEREAFRESGTFPWSNKTPGGWQGSWNLLTAALGYQHASWGRRKSTGSRALKSAPWSLLCPRLTGSSRSCHFSSLSLSFSERQITISGQKGSSSLHRGRGVLVLRSLRDKRPLPCPPQLYPRCPRPTKDEPLTLVFLCLPHLTQNPLEGASLDSFFSTDRSFLLGSPPSLMDSAFTAVPCVCPCSCLAERALK